MKHNLAACMLLLCSLSAFGQASHKPIPASHKAQVLSRIGLLEVQFGSTCARTANHAENKQCASELVSDMQTTFKKLSLSEIPVPDAASSAKVVLVYNEEVNGDTDTVTLTVYETENNDKLYSDSRKRLILSNDLTKLLAGYIETIGSN
jgi:hypothetical protein